MADMASISQYSLDPSQKILANGLDARRMRKAIFRRTIDYNASIITYLKERIWQRNFKQKPALQPDYLYNFRVNPPREYLNNPMNCVTGKPVRTSTNKNKCPIYCVCWTPEGRRLITGAYSGEFTLWNGLTFNFETILQAHESQIRCMKWSHNDEWLLTADHSGYVKYWQANMNNVEMYQAHKEPIRGVSFSPFDTKFVTCSDDSTVRIWDFLRCTEERVLRGHGSDVRSVAWHPYKSLLISGSKDAQQPIKLWEPKTGESVATLYVHKNTCTDVAWNRNGNWFLTASRDHLIKLFDLRSMKSELQTFRGHKRDVMRVSWHPCHEGLFASGSADGAILFWSTGTDTELGAIDDAHESMIWSLAWHPLGHILVSGANDFATKFWTRNRPGDILRDILSTANTSGLPVLAPVTGSLTNGVIRGVPSMGLTDRVSDEVGGSLARALADAVGRMPIFESNEILLPMPVLPTEKKRPASEEVLEQAVRVEIPGINEGFVRDLNISETDDGEERSRLRQSRSIPKEFAASWASTRNKAAAPADSLVSTALPTPPSLPTAEPLITSTSEDSQPTTTALPDSQAAQKAESGPPKADPPSRPPTEPEASRDTSHGDADHHHRPPPHKRAKIFDSATREDEMLAFASGLSVNKQSSKGVDSRPQPGRFNKPLSARFPAAHALPPPAPDHRPPRGGPDRFFEAPRLPLDCGPERGPNILPAAFGPPAAPPSRMRSRDYASREEERHNGWNDYQAYPDQPPPPPMGPWRHDKHPMDREFREHPPPIRAPFRGAQMPPQRWAGQTRYREDTLPGRPFPPPPKRPSGGQYMCPPRPMHFQGVAREPWSDPKHMRSGWQ